MQTYTDRPKIFGFLGNLLVGIRKIKIRKYIFRELGLGLAGIRKLFGVKIMWESKLNYVT